VVKIHDMRRSEREKKAVADRLIGPMRPQGNDFAHGLHIRLGEDELNKIGISGMPRFGDQFRVEGEMKVTDATARDSERPGSTRDVEFVLHRLGAEPKASPADRDRDPTIREELEKARHQAGGSTMPPGRGAPLGARFNSQRRA
jgi:hypothetical protein